MTRVNKKSGQSIIEYAAIITVVVSALMAMNVYVQRAAQANLKIVQDQISPDAVENSRAGFGVE